MKVGSNNCVLICLYFSAMAKMTPAVNSVQLNLGNYAADDNNQNTLSW